MTRMKFIFQLIVLALIALSLAGCGKEQPAAQQEVVVYTSLDKVFSQPILEEFERKCGIKVKAVYDSEATKTTGLVNRLIAEKDSPRADVFWNSETGRTIVLKQKGVLASYKSPSAADISSTFKDRDGYWSGFGARCRILIYNTRKLKESEGLLKKPALSPVCPAVTNCKSLMSLFSKNLFTSVLLIIIANISAK